MSLQEKLEKSYKKAGSTPETALDCLIYEINAVEAYEDGTDQEIIDIIKGILAGDSVFGDKTYAEAGQKSIMPEYWRPACKYMESQGVTPDTAEKYLRDKIAEMEA